jgi:hypothetical protein
MSSPLQPIEDGLYNLLAASTALTTALGGTAIYIRDVPAGIAPPYVVIDTVRATDLNICPHRMRGALFSVQGISTAGAAQAGTLDGLCDAVLHDGTPSVTGWTSLRCFRQRDIAYRELPGDGREYFHAGGEYDVIVTKS